MIRHLNLGDLVYITENRKIETYIVIDDPTPRLQRYRLKSLDDGREIQLKLDPDNPLWRHVFRSYVDTFFDVQRQEQEMKDEIQRRVNEWADQHIDAPEQLIRCLYQGWRAANYYAAHSEFGLPSQYMPEAQIVRDAREQIVAQRIHEYFGVDVESDSDEEKSVKEKLE